MYTVLCKRPTLRFCKHKRNWLTRQHLNDFRFSEIQSTDSPQGPSYKPSLGCFLYVHRPYLQRLIRSWQALAKCNHPASMTVEPQAFSCGISILLRYCFLGPKSVSIKASRRLATLVVLTHSV